MSKTLAYVCVTMVISVLKTVELKFSGFFFSLHIPPLAEYIFSSNTPSNSGAWGSQSIE